MIVLLVLLGSCSVHSIDPRRTTKHAIELEQGRFSIRKQSSRGQHQIEMSKRQPGNSVVRGERILHNPSTSLSVGSSGEVETVSMRTNLNTSGVHAPTARQESMKTKAQEEEQEVVGSNNSMVRLDVGGSKGVYCVLYKGGADLPNHEWCYQTVGGTSKETLNECVIEGGVTARYLSKEWKTITSTQYDDTSCEDIGYEEWLSPDFVYGNLVGVYGRDSLSDSVFLKKPSSFIWWAFTYHLWYPQCGVTGLPIPLIR
jgi:hypothetical protein